MAANSKGESPKFLAGWKDISNYLGKGVRTVQRYEREMGLPVRRPAGRSRAAVVATKAELDAWIAASPFRDVLVLQPPLKDYAARKASLMRNIEEMTRLRGQMTALRIDLIASVSLLAQTVRTVHDGMNDALGNSRIYSAADLENRAKAAFDLLATSAARKAS